MDPILPLTPQLRDLVEDVVETKFQAVLDRHGLAANELHDLILWISAQPRLPESFRGELSERLSDIASHLRHDS